MKYLKNRKRILIILVVILMYFGVHLGISRLSQGIIESSEFPKGGFYYIPVSPNFMAQHPSLQILNDALKAFFYPAWVLDHHILQGPDYAYPPLRDIHR